MYYSKRRMLRYRMMRRAVFKNHIKDAATIVKDLIPDLLTACGMWFLVFYLLPVVISIFAISIQ